MAFEHALCKNHVSLGLGACYCPKSNAVYVSSQASDGMLPEDRPLSRWDGEKFLVHLALLLKVWPQVRPSAWVLLDNAVDMSGLRNDGVKPENDPLFKKGKHS